MRLFFLLLILLPVAAQAQLESFTSWLRGPSTPIHRQCSNAPQPPNRAVMELDNGIDVRCNNGRPVRAVQQCGFDEIRRAAREAGHECKSERGRIACHQSMWRNLTMEQKINRVVKLSREMSPDFGLDPRAFPCVAARESRLEPLAVSSGVCTRNATDEGLGQVVFPTFKDLVENHGFQSKIPPYNQGAYLTDTRLLFNAMGLNVKLQTEVSMAIMQIKLRSAKGKYLVGFEFYNGSDDKKAYGHAVNACFECLAHEKSSSPDTTLKCLELASPGLEASFKESSRLCSADGGLAK